MVTIRNNVFETNSSSTHSISICGINQEQDILLEDGVLYPERLRVSDKDYDGNWVIIAQIMEHKLALVCHWVLSLSFENDDESLLKKFEELFKVKISDEFTYSNFYPYNDNGKNSLLYDNFDNDLLYLKGIIYDVDKQIVEKETEY